MSRRAVDLRQELSELKQRAAEIERELGLGTVNASESSVVPTTRQQFELQQSQLREALKKALSEWRRTFDAVELPMAVLDGGGHLLRLNRAALELAGHPIEELQLRKLVDLDLPAPWPEVASFLDTVLRDPTACATQVSDAATGRTWELSISLDDAEPAENARVILILRDVTPPPSLHN